MMRALAAGALLVAAPLAAAPEPPRLTQSSDGRVDLVGLDAGGAVVSGCELEGELWLLVRPADAPDAPRRLLRLARAPAPRVEERGTVPGWAKTLDALELASGVELLVGGLGEVASLGPARTAGSREPRRLLADPDLDLRSLDGATLRRGARRDFAVASAGRVRGLEVRDLGIAVSYSARLPLTASREGGALRLRSPPGQRLSAAGGPLLLFGPEAVGRTRLRTTLLDPRAAAAAGARESWSRLPAAERVEQSRYLLFDGVPFLVVRTQGSERLNLLERMRLRVLPLGADRTRAGAPATFAAELDSRRWHELDLAAADGDGDGLDDLVVLRPEGLRGQDLVVESYPGRGGGRFAPRARRVDLSGPFDAFRYGADADGDGAPDLATVGGGELELRPGRGGRDPVARTPAWRARLSDAGQRRAPAGEPGAELGRARVDAGVELLGAVALGADGRAWVAALVRREDGFDELFLASAVRRQPR